jgi:Holliday junction DNA helicase RuvA
MIAFLRGRLIVKSPNQVVVDVNGVGYSVNIPVSTFSELPDRGAEAELFIYTHVREDTLALYGFLTEKEKMLFERLISVSGIGPRLAITLLSGLQADELIAAIRAGDVQRLVHVPGVGRKTGERLVLELREKMDFAAAAAAAGFGPARSSLEEDVISALLNLGCARAAAQSAVQRARQNGAPAEFEPLFRAALKLAAG